MAGVEIMAGVYLNLARREALARLDALGLAGPAGLLAIAIEALGNGAAAGLAFVHGHLWLPLALPLGVIARLAILAALALRYARARVLVRRLAPRPVAAQLLDGGRSPNRSYRTEPATVMFRDLVGSTALGTKLGAEAYGALIQSFYDTVAAAIEVERGVVVEVPGDGVLAVFPAPMAGARDAGRALAAARRLCRAVDTEAGRGTGRAASGEC